MSRERRTDGVMQSISVAPVKVKYPIIFPIRARYEVTVCVISPTGMDNFTAFAARIINAFDCVGNEARCYTARLLRSWVGPLEELARHDLDLPTDARHADGNGEVIGFGSNDAGDVRAMPYVVIWIPSIVT